MPDFMGIGAMRSGTSWLSHHLRRHPEIWLGKKELHFFDRELDARAIPILPREIEARSRYALKFIPGRLAGKVVGECTPAYAVLERDAIARIHAWCPRVRLLFMMRDPVERAWSHARKSFLSKRGRPVAEASEAELKEFLEGPFTRRRGDYAWVLANWLSFYDRDQLFIAFFDELESDPGGLLRAVFQFLGVDPDVPLDRREMASRVNPRPQAPMPEWVRSYLSDIFYKDTTRLEDLCGREVPWRRGKE